MSCFGCFGKQKDGKHNNHQHVSEQKGPTSLQLTSLSEKVSSVTQATQAPAVASIVSNSAPAPEPAAVAQKQPSPPWRSREELADIALRIADVAGPWLERAQASAVVLASSLGATLVSIWAFSSDKSTAVVLASSGALVAAQPQGYSIVLASVEGRSESSLQRVLASEASLTWSRDGLNSTSGGTGAGPEGHGGPSDLAHLASTAGIQHCAVLPLKYGGAIAGALQITLGSSPPKATPARTVVSPSAGAGESGTVPAAQDACGAVVSAKTAAAAIGASGQDAPAPNWPPCHLPDLMLLSSAVSAAALSGVGSGLPSHTGSGLQAVSQAVVDLVAALRRCDTISKLVIAISHGLQDLVYRSTAMHFCATPMFVHRSATTAAIFQEAGARDGAGKDGNTTRGEIERDSKMRITSAGSAPGDSQEQSRAVKAHITHLNHTLLLQILTGVDSSRYRQYGGSIIQNCSEYMQDESNRGRDVSLCHRVGVADVGSMVLATGMLTDGAPLLAVYMTSKEPLPERLLETAMAVAHQALKLSVLTVQTLLFPGGDLNDEWSTLHDFHLNPTSVAVSTSCTPRSIIPRSSAAREPLQHQTSGVGGTQGATAPLTVTPSSIVQEDGNAVTCSGTTTRRHLSFGITTTSAAAPRSNLGMMVSSIRSSLNQVLSQRAALEAEGLQDDVNGVELLKQIGQGGQGVVFCGTLHGLEVAIKVVGTEEGADEVYDIDDEGQMIKLKRVLKRDATELAVTTSISHPNIVQVFSYFVDVMVVEYVGQPDRFKLLPKAKGLGSNGGPEGGLGVTGPSNMIICMEYCDAGSLKHAVKRGCFRTAGSRPNTQALYTTLMEIALALRHLHALRLVHCDLKPSNILLKSSMRDPRGWVCKLSDFGCVRLMSEPAPGQRPTFNLEYAVGTPSFMAPEMFCKGHPLDAMVDMYSFGILMWEVYTGGTVYDGVPPDKLPYHVVKRGLRPAFPPDTPSAYRSLAQTCWSSDPRSRPSAAALVTVLQRLLSSCTVAATAPTTAASPASGAAAKGGAA